MSSIASRACVPVPVCLSWLRMNIFHAFFFSPPSNFSLILGTQANEAGERSPFRAERFQRFASPALFSRSLLSHSSSSFPLRPFFHHSISLYIEADSFASSIHFRLRRRFGGCRCLTISIWIRNAWRAEPPRTTIRLNV